MRKEPRLHKKIQKEKTGAQGWGIGVFLAYGA